MKLSNKFNLDKYLLLAGILALPLFVILFWLVFPLMYPEYNLLTTGVSYLGGYESPIRTLVNVFGFGLWGFLTMMFGYGVFRSNLLKVLGKTAGIFLIIGGFMIYLVSLFQGPYESWIYTLAGQLHNFFSNYPFIPIGIAIFLFLFEFVINKRFRWLILPIIILGPASLYLNYQRAFPGGGLTYFGIYQRASLTLPYIIIMLIAISLYKNTNSDKEIA